MDKERKVIEFYKLCNILKDTIRTGWINWNVNRDRLESVAEHIYSTQMLALAMKSEYQYDIDIEKVIKMLAIHELGETIIGDLTLYDKNINNKEKIEHDAVHYILNTLIDGKEIEELFLEFDEHKTKESIFAYQCDKLECDLQSKIYDQENCVDLNSHKNRVFMHDKPKVKELVDKGYSFSNMWLYFGQQRYPYDDNFMAVSNYAIENGIEESFTRKLKK